MHRPHRTAAAVITAVVALVVGPFRTEAAPPELADDGRVGVVADLQGTALVRPAGRERWTPVGPRTVLLPGDELRTLARGAHAAEIRLANGGSLVLGPGTQTVLDGRTSVHLLAGDCEVAPAKDGSIDVAGPGKFASKVTATTVLRAGDTATTALGEPPRWLTGYRASTTDEWMGSLLAKVDGRDVPLSVGHHKVGVTIRDQVAETVVDQTFVNSTDATLEGVFTFPLPADASVSGFAMWVGNEMVEADVVERDRARQIYETIKAERRDPGLLEWSGGNLFTANVFPIFPHSEKRVRLRYTQVLPLEGASMRYRYALRSELLRRNPVRELEIRVSATSGVAIRSAASPTHEVRTTNSGTSATAEFRASQYAPDRDFEVVFTTDAASPLRVVPHRRGDDGYFMVLLAPPDASAGPWRRELVPEGRPLDVVFVADTSGSTGPAERRAQRAFLEAALALLGPSDRFRLMASDARSVWHDPNPVAATPENAAKALAFLDGRSSLGWTDIDSAMTEAASKVADGAVVVYVGDGIPTTGDADPVACAQRIGRMTTPAGVSFHAVAVGSSYESGVMQAIAAHGGSFRETRDDPARAAAALVTEIAQPPVKDLRVEFEGFRTARVYPERLPNLAAGAQQIVLGRFLPEGDAARRGRVTVTGRLGDQPVRYTADVVLEPGAEGDGNSFLPRLWARRHLDALLAEGRTPAIRDEIVSMSERFGILTPYTSLLVLESDEDRERFGVARRVAMRDGERFFTESRSAAATAALRAGMLEARGWRVGLRRRMLAEIATLGRNLALGEVVTARGEPFSGPGTNRTIGIGGGAGGGWGGPTTGGVYRGRTEDLLGMDGGDEGTVLELGKAEERKLEDRNDSEDGEEADKDVPADSREPSDPPAPPGSPPFDDWGPGTPGGDYDAPGGEIAPAAARKASFSRNSIRRRSGRSDDAPSDVAPPRAPRDRTVATPLSWVQLSLFPDVGAAVDPPSTPPTAAEAAKLLAAVSAHRNRAIDAGSHIEVTWNLGSVGSDDTYWPQMRSRALLSPDRWAVDARSTTTEPVLDWLDGDRGTMFTGVRLGRRRASVERDRSGWFPHAAPHDSDPAREFANWTANVTTRGEAQSVVTLTDPSHSGVRVVLTIDVAKSVVVRREQWVRDEMTWTRTASDFVAAGGIWWPRLEEFRAGLDDVVTHRVVRAVRDLTADDFGAALRSELAGREDVIFVPAELPTAEQAKQAANDGRAGIADRLVIAAAHAATQRWDDAWGEWTKARALIASAMTSAPGADWLELALATAGRRGEVVASTSQRLAESVVAKGGPAAWGLTVRIEGFAQNVLGIRERLALAEILDRAKDAAAPDDELAWHRDMRRIVRASLLEQAGRQAEATDIRRALWNEQPTNLSRATAYLGTLANSGEAEAAAAVLDALKLEDAPRRSPHVPGLFDLTFRALANEGRLDRALAVAERGQRVRPESAEPYGAALRTLVALERIQDFDAWIAREVKAEKLPGKDAAARARLGAAISEAIGTQSNRWWSEPWWNRAADPVWIEPLGELAQRLVRGTDGDVELAARIVGDANWRQTESHRRTLDRIRDVLAAPGGVESPKPRDLATVVSWFSWTREESATAVWRGVADRVKARWRAASGDDRQVLLSVVLSMLDQHLERDEAIAVLREELAVATPTDLPRIADDLLTRIESGPWTQATEDECFALAARLVPADVTPGGERSARALAVRRLARRMVAARTEAALPPMTEREKLARSERRLREQTARTAARTGFAARLREEEKSAPATLRPWLVIERLALLAETGGDAKEIEGEARELLLSVEIPPKGDDDGDAERIAYLGDVLRERCVLVLSSLAVRRNAPDGLAERVLELLADRLQKEPETLDWRYARYRLLVALDRPAELETALRADIAPTAVASRARLSLGWLLAETGRVREAAEVFESAAALDELGETEWAALANWYLVLGEDARREIALARRYDKIDEWRLQQRLWSAQGRLQSGGDGVPSSLDDETLRVITAYMTKSSYPSNALWPMRNIYNGTKDFRVLAALADAVTGHSPEAVYPFLTQAANVIEGVHDEATCDALRERITSRSRTAATDTDRRGLTLLLCQVERRAAEVLDQNGPHAQRAVESLRAARRGAWQPGERRHMADFLQQLGQIPHAALAEEQLAFLRELHAAEKKGTDDRFAVALALHRTEWAYGRHDAAIDGLRAALDEIRPAPGAALPQQHADSANTLASWMEEVSHHRDAEAWLSAEAGRQQHPRMREWYEQRIFRTWVHALGAGGTVSLGSRDDLYRAARSRIGAATLTSSHSTASEVLGAYCDLHRVAHRKSIGNVGADLVEASRALLPEITSLRRTQASELTRIFAEAVAETAGPVAALTILVERIEREPSWYAERARGFGSWQAYSWQMGKWREDAKDVGALAPRLLAIVLRELERDLAFEQPNNRSIYGRHQHFWSEKAGEFATVARRVLELQAGSPGVVHHAANYLWHELNLRPEAADTLLAAERRGGLRADGRTTLVTWLHELRRWQDSLAPVERLVADSPDDLRFRLLRITTLHYVERDDDARRALEEARVHMLALRAAGRIAPFHAALARLANVCGWNDVAISLFPEAISERRRITRGAEDGELSNLYVGLAGALSAAGRHDEAVDAASNAVVIWGSAQRGRAEALQALRGVVSKISDLGAWASKREAAAAASGLDAPVLRIAIGDAFLARRDADSALRHLEAARRIAPEDATVHERIAKAYEMKNDAAGRCAALATAIQYVRNEPKLCVTLAEALRKLGRADDAERALTTLAELAPTEPEGHALLADARTRAARPADAAVQWRHVARARPTEPRGWNGLVRSLLDAGDKAGAKAALAELFATPWGAAHRTDFAGLEAEAAR